MGVLKEKRDWGRIAKTPDQSGKYRCSMCREWKEPSEFYRNKTQKSGLNYACKPCMKMHTRKYSLPAKYGITVAKFAEMILKQGNKCACCGAQFEIDGKKSDKPCVDHNHTTKEVRDLLCGRCNLAAGNVKDSSEYAKKLMVYLKKWNC